MCRQLGHLLAPACASAANPSLGPPHALPLTTLCRRHSRGLPARPSPPPLPTIAISLCVVPPPVRHPRPQHRAAPPPASRACSWLAPPPPRSPPLDLTLGSADLAVGEHLQRLTLQVRSSPQRHSPPTPSLPVAFPRPPHRIWMEIQPGLGICR
jgi:hypothetical protein